MARESRAEKYAALYSSTEAELHALLSRVPIALRELIEGVWREEALRNGDTRIYQEKPNIEAIKLLFERTLGKVATKVEVEGQLNTTSIDLSEYKDSDVTKLLELSLARRKGSLGGPEDGLDE